MILELLSPEENQKPIAILFENYSKYFDYFPCWFSGERSLLFLLLVVFIADFWF